MDVRYVVGPCTTKRAGKRGGSANPMKITFKKVAVTVRAKPRGMAMDRAW